MAHPDHPLLNMLTAAAVTLSGIHLVKDRTNIGTCDTTTRYWDELPPEGVTLYQWEKAYLALYPDTDHMAIIMENGFNNGAREQRTYRLPGDGDTGAISVTFTDQYKLHISIANCAGELRYFKLKQWPPATPDHPPANAA